MRHSGLSELCQELDASGCEPKQLSEDAAIKSHRGADDKHYRSLRRGELPKGWENPGRLPGAGGIGTKPSKETGFKRWWGGTEGQEIQTHIPAGAGG